MKPAVLYHTNQAAKTRCQILQVAVDIASAEGLEGLSIGRLAAELQMSKTVYLLTLGVWSKNSSRPESS
jgi:hypothetical protein